ncbi:hypothetical protein PCK2_000415 [Pneumocystis canis]|nr:hypothetical protein PCK2_000415 [Pneumocystis canis]
MKIITYKAWFKCYSRFNIYNFNRLHFFSIYFIIQRSFYGQPINITHPHLIQTNELTPGISVTEYAHRRARLAATLPANSLLILIGACLKYKTASSFYPFHQNPNFFYLTGVNEPWTIFIMGNISSFIVIYSLTIERDHTDSDFESYLFMRSKNPAEERWEGPRTGIEAARTLFSIDRVYDIREVDHILSQCMRRASQIYTDYPLKTCISQVKHESDISSILDKVYERLESYSTLPIAPWIHHLREIKSPAELKLMEQAACRSAAAFNIAMQISTETETLLWAKLSYEFKIRNCEEAYVPVVAGGHNALIIHYTMNNMPLRKGDLVLVDAGGEYGNYVTDISRTWPVNGIFSPAQKDLYQAVLNVQKACIQLCSEEHAISLNMIHQHSIELFKEELKNLGFNITYSDLRHILYPHHIGHQIELNENDDNNTYENVNNDDNYDNQGKELLKNTPSNGNKNQTLKLEKKIDEFSAALKALDINIESTNEILGLQKNSGTNLATLSLLEYIIRLTALQTCEQTSLLSVTDERISLFLRDDNYNNRARERKGAIEYGQTPFSSPLSVKQEKDSIKSQDTRKIYKKGSINYESLIINIISNALRIVKFSWIEMTI